MPIFQEDAGSQTSPLQADTLYPASQRQYARKDLPFETLKYERFKLLNPDTSCPPEASGGFVAPEDSSHRKSDRGDLVEWLGQDESPGWIPKPLGTYVQGQLKHTGTSGASSQYLPLLPSPTFMGPDVESDIDVERNKTGLQIERPRSALHSGDFTESRHQDTDHESRHLVGRRRFDISPWQSTSPPRPFASFSNEGKSPNSPLPNHRQRAPSLSSSLSSSFVLKPPTSPLVQSQSNEDLELARHINPIDIDLEFGRNSRRHTLYSSQSSYSSLAPQSIGRQPPQLRRDNTFPYQAHQPRRSLTSNSLSQPPSTPHTPLSRSRRPSFSEGSPLHASMVGSYEESILRGRMSTNPSKPLDFVAQIGVLGLGKCKPSLRCPSHVTVPFPAVFYSYETTSHGRATKSSDEPSPYVGQIDLENNLPHQHARREKRRQHAAASSILDNPGGSEHPDAHVFDDVERASTRASKQRIRSISPRTPAGGSYRIPEKGQLQIIIKNPNKTAVKLFLIPYDLAGMEPGTKTFIRQRSYSVGPVLDAPSAMPRIIASGVDRPVLRYLVHLHICSPSRGRFYLYKSIRIVFANRVPDGKEKLRNEISLPEPRFSVYKPGREHGTGIPGSMGAHVVAEIAQRRRSSGYTLAHVPYTHEDHEGLQRIAEKIAPMSSANGMHGSGAPPIQPIPFSFARTSNYGKGPANPEASMTVNSPSSSKSSRLTTSSHSDQSTTWDGNGPSLESYNKLKRGDVGYGGNVFAEHIHGNMTREGLLARKLKDLGVQHTE